MIYIGVVLAIASECRDGRTPCAHRRTPDEGPPTKKQSTGLFFSLSCVSLALGISRSAERDSGRRPETLPAFRERLELKLLYLWRIQKVRLLGAAIPPGLIPGGRSYLSPEISVRRTSKSTYLYSST